MHRLPREQIECIGVNDRRLSSVDRGIPQGMTPGALAETGPQRNNARSIDQNLQRLWPIDAARDQLGTSSIDHRHMRLTGSHADQPCANPQGRFGTQHNRARHAVFATDSKHMSKSSLVDISRPWRKQARQRYVEQFRVRLKWQEHVIGNLQRIELQRSATIRPIGSELPALPADEADRRIGAQHLALGNSAIGIESGRNIKCELAPHVAVHLTDQRSGHARRRTRQAGAEQTIDQDIGSRQQSRFIGYRNAATGLQPDGACPGRITVRACAHRDNGNRESIGLGQRCQQKRVAAVVATAGNHGERACVGPTSAQQRIRRRSRPLHQFGAGKAGRGNRRLIDAADLIDAVKRAGDVGAGHDRDYTEHCAPSLHDRMLAALRADPLTMPTIDYFALAADIRLWANELGFQQLGVAGVDLEKDEAYLLKWLDAGRHGEMDYMARHGSKRSRPDELLPGTMRVISVRMDYLPVGARDGWEVLADPDRAYVARYAIGRDYHKLMRNRLQKLATRIADQVGPFGYRAFVDSAPVLERALARDAGLGWIGKHTCLINRQAGSWFFLGELYTDLPLPLDTPETEHCGTCRRCIDVCPTQAIVAPYQVDARRCISYLTIELRGDIPLELRRPMGNRIFGCDDCQLVCPWNKFARHSPESDFTPRHSLDDRSLIELFAWSEEEFLTRTEGSPIRRTGHLGWLRNIAVALGNASYSSATVEALQSRLAHPSELVREHVQWALREQASKKQAQPRPE